jgi:membrane associated rhomboid family serine protease
VIPIGDEPNEPGTPIVNWLLIAANVLVFAWARLSAHDDRAYQALVERYGTVPVAPTVTTAFTSMFMHAGLLHLAGNMLYLWIFGDNVEARLGHVGYLLAYLATGLAGGLVDGAMRPESAIPGVGASGAISGVLGMYLVGFPRNRVRVLLFVWWYMGVVHVPAWVVLILYFVVQNLFPAFFMGHESQAIAYGAHIGGFSAGVLLFLLLLPWIRRPRVEIVASPYRGGYGWR